MFYAASSKNFKQCVKLQLHLKLLAHYSITKRFWPPYCFWHFEGEKQKIGKAMGQIRIQHLKIVLKPFQGIFYSKMP